MLSGAEKKQEPSNSPPPPPPLVEMMKLCWSTAVESRPTADIVYRSFNGDVAPAVRALKADIGQVSASKPTSESIIGVEISGSGVGGRVGPNAAAPQHTAHGFLELAGLEKYAKAFSDQGFSDKEALFDRDVLDDGTLAEVFGMSKMEVRKFRVLVESKGKSLSLNRSSRLKLSRTNANNSSATSNSQRRLPARTADLNAYVDNLENGFGVSI